MRLPLVSVLHRDEVITGRQSGTVSKRIELNMYRGRKNGPTQVGFPPESLALGVRAHLPNFEDGLFKCKRGR